MLILKCWCLEVGETFSHLRKYSLKLVRFYIIINLRLEGKEDRNICGNKNVERLSHSIQEQLNKNRPDWSKRSLTRVSLITARCSDHQLCLPVAEKVMDSLNNWTETLGQKIGGGDSLVQWLGHSAWVQQTT